MVDKSKYILQFKKLYEEKKGERISEELALEYFENLLSLLKVIYKPNPTNDKSR